MGRKVDLESMQRYLGYALQFENYVYDWNKCLNSTKQRLIRIQNEKQKTLNQIDDLEGQIVSNEIDNTNYYNELEKNKKKRGTIIVVIILILALIVGFSLVTGLIYSKNIQMSMVFTLAKLMGFFPILIIVVVVLLLLSRNKINSKADLAAAQNSNRRKNAINQDNINSLKSYIKQLDQEEADTLFVQNQVFEQLESAKKTRARIYSANLIHPYFQNSIAVAKMYEYLVTGVCNTIEGPGGIFALCRQEMREDWQHEQIMHELMKQTQLLTQIRDYQKQILSEIQETNRMLFKLSTSLESIGKQLSRIEASASISAAANMQTAAASQYIAHEVWWNS